MKKIFESYLEYYTNLKPDNVKNLTNLAANDLHFVDPFNDVKDINKVVDIFKHMFKKLDQPCFEVLTTYENNNCLFVEWDFKFTFWLVNRGKQHTIRGMSIVKADSEDQKIIEHIDYWDSATQLYMHMPIIKYFFLIIRKFV